MDSGRIMGFGEHLGELRKRLIRILLGLIAGSGVGLVFAPTILKLILAPYGNQLKVIGPTEGISNFLGLGVTCGAILAMPYILWELWGFIAPGLEPKEKRYVYVLLPAVFLMFLGGIAFAWFLLIPTAINFLSNFNLGIFQIEWTSQNYIPFVTSLLFWLGVCFELPLVVFFLAKLGIVTSRMLLKGWRYAIVIIFVIAMIITPTVDPFNMTIVALPLILLYFLGIFLAFIARRKKPEAKPES